MEKQKPKFGFKLMALTFRIRDFFSPRTKILAEVGIQPGWSILDYGCGPGGYIKDAADLAGPGGRSLPWTSTPRRWPWSTNWA